jgi:putative two-component system response regulator
VLVIDDIPANMGLLERLLEPEGYLVMKASDGEHALTLMSHMHPDVILADVRMPKVDGFELCRRLKADPVTRLIPIVLMTAGTAVDDRMQAIEAGADDFLVKPIDPTELRARIRSLLRLKRFTDDLDSAESVLRSLALMVEARDPYTEGHCQRLSTYGVVLGRRLGLPDEDVVALRRGGYFHDIGKIAIPDAILLKPGPLSREEFRRMQEHVVIGSELCGRLRVLQHVRPIVRHHHERLDGSGYPDHLRGDQVPLLAQIISIVDMYDAMTTDRPYRKAGSPEAACDELVEEARRGWRRTDLVNQFVGAVQAGELGGS